MDLLKNAPGLMDAVKEAGMPEDKVSDLGSLLGAQLGGGDGLDLTDLLGGLDLDGFLSRVDIGNLAEQLGVSPEIVQQAVNVLGPVISDFQPSEGLGGLVGKLLG
jgi:hypothetical protein